MFVRAVLVVMAPLALIGALLLSTESAAAAGPVGNGSAASCTDAALTTALNAGGGGGLVTFNCGADPVEIVIGQKTISYAANTTIDGNNLVTLSGAALNRLFLVNASRTLTLQNIRLVDGRGVGADGGAIRNNGTLFLINSTISTSEAGLSGGAIRTDGPLTIINSTLTANRAQNGGALFPFGSAATVTIINSELGSNQATGAAPDAGWGGAILMFGAMNVTIQGSDLHDNSGAYGGAIHSRFAGASLNLQSGTQVRNNEASEQGGGIYNLSGTATLTNVTLSLNVAQIGDTIFHSGGAIYSESGTVALGNVSIIGNSGAFFGGGIYKSGGSADLNNVTISDNSAVGGGGVWNDGGTITLTNVIVSGNDQGGIDNLNGTAMLNNVTLSGNSGSVNLTGGGMSNSGTAVLTNVTLSGNSASSGGGFFNFVGTATMINVTISSNSAAGVQGVGGGITNRYGAVTLTNVTLSGNSAAVHGGGIFNESNDAGDTITLKNTIIANSSAGGNCYREPGQGTIVSTGFNLSDDASCTPYFNQLGDQNNPLAGAGLGPLANNGGQTQTHLPMPGSLAINHGANSGCPAADQRGLPRVGTCDVGSVEVQTSELATYTPTQTRTATLTTTPSITSTLTRTPTASHTLTPTPTASGTPTPSPTTPGAPTVTVSGTPTPTATQGLVTSTPPPSATQGVATSTSVVTSTPISGTLSVTPTLASPTPTLSPDTLDRISVYLQGATGGFQADVRASAAGTLLLPAGGLNAVDIGIGDLTGDGLPDLVAVGTTDQGAGVRVLYPNLGQGALGVPTVFPSSRVPAAMALANVNGNGIADLAVAGSAAGLGQIEYFPDGALGVFSQSFAVLGEPSALALGRLTADDLPDFAVAVGSSVQVVRDGVTPDPCGVGAAPRALTVGRSALLSGAVVDADLDLFAAGPGGVRIIENSIAPGPPPVGFCPPGAPTLTLGSGLDVADLALADLNGDGLLDVLALTANPPAVISFLAGAAPGSYGSGVTSAVAANPVAFDVLPATLGASPGLVVVHAPGAGPGRVSVLGGSFGGSFTPLLQSLGLACPPNPRLRIAVGDLNGDGLSDFAVSGCAPAAGVPGGHGISLLTNPTGPALAQVRWSGGTLQIGYRGLRIALPSSAVTFFPAGGGVFPADATGFDDPFPGEMGCYLTSVLGAPGPGPFQISDVICLFRGLASGATPPNFKARLDDTLTTLTWSAPAGQTGYTLLVIPTDGSALGLRDFGPGVTSTTHETSGAVVCYQLRTLGVVVGRTDVLCSVPNAGTLGAGGATTGGLFERLRAALDASRVGTAHPTRGLVDSPSPVMLPRVGPSPIAR